MARLTAPNGAKVHVADDRVEHLVRLGFTEEKKAKAPAKRAASSDSEK